MQEDAYTTGSPLEVSRVIRHFFCARKLLLAGGCVSLANWATWLVRPGIVRTPINDERFFLQLEKFSVANEVEAIGLAPLAKFDSVCDTVQGEDKYAENEA